LPFTDLIAFLLSGVHGAVQGTRVRQLIAQVTDFT